jgi:hypothetical protein
VEASAASEMAGITYYLGLGSALAFGKDLGNGSHATCVSQRSM